MEWLIRLDERLFLALNSSGVPSTDLLFTIITYGGHGLVLAFLVIVPMALFDRQKLRAHLAAMILSVVIGALAVEIVKSVAQRDRPVRHFAAAENPNAQVVRMPFHHLYTRSFPSGHTQTAFGTATYLTLLYPSLGVPIMGSAMLVGISRIYLGVHFPLDVLVGALFGIGFSVGGFRLLPGAFKDGRVRSCVQRRSKSRPR